MKNIREILESRRLFLKTGKPKKLSYKLSTSRKSKKNEKCLRLDKFLEI